jgi:hypothetical protein
MIGGYWDVFRSLLDQLAHEDDLLVSRTFWLLVSQFLLLVGYFSIDGNKLQTRPALNHFQLIGVTGMLSTAFIYSAILAAELDFVELRGRIIQLAAEHPDLPMRKLPTMGIGSGLLCPILLALLVLYLWVRLSVSGRWAAILSVISGALFAVFVVGWAQESQVGTMVTTLVRASLPVAIALLASAVIVGILSRRVQS